MPGLIIRDNTGPTAGQKPSRLLNTTRRQRTVPSSASDSVCCRLAEDYLWNTRNQAQQQDRRMSEGYTGSWGWFLSSPGSLLMTTLTYVVRSLLNNNARLFLPVIPLFISPSFQSDPLLIHRLFVHLSLISCFLSSLTRSAITGVSVQEMPSLVIS